MKISVIGTGYVGLVSGACFAEMGNQVVCVDVDAGKVARLRQGEIPIHEPGLEQIVEQTVADNLLSFTTSLPEAMQTAEILIIAVGTPPGEDGSADLSHVLAVAAEIGRHLERYMVVVDKSTVPVGTADLVREAIQQQLDARGADIAFDVVSNPEFLKEGAAIKDFMSPDRIIVGTDSERASRLMAMLYAPFSRTRDKIIYMGIREAEMAKYAANCMLATKISFMNEIANLCERLDADVESVRKGIGSDSRIGYDFIYPGCGYGGSCFPKDVKALIHMANKSGFEPLLMNAVEARNEQQKRTLFAKLRNHFGVLQGKTIAIWGLAFKPDTDDMREASSVVLINELIMAGAKVLAHDPIAEITAKREFPQKWFEEGLLKLVEHQYDVLDRADALVLVTEWKQYRQPDFDRIGKVLRVIVDGRNQYNPKQLRDLGFTYYGVGR